MTKHASDHRAATRRRPHLPSGAIAAGFLLLLGAAGCESFRPGGDPGEPPPRDAQSALTRINRNQAQLRETLYCPSLVSFRFRDRDGKQHRHVGQDALLVFRGPRTLLFNVKSLAGVLAQFGSTSDRYWLWVDTDGRKMWWGAWANVSRLGAQQLPIPPEDLLDALMLRPLPSRLGGGAAPTLRADRKGARLVYLRGAPNHGRREIRLAPSAPYLPIEIIDRAADGSVLMQALLSNYERIGDDGPYTPRRYVVTWPQDDAELRLDVHRARFRPDLEDFCEFPESFDGRVEALDAAINAALPR